MATVPRNNSCGECMEEGSRCNRNCPFNDSYNGLRINQDGLISSDYEDNYAVALAKSMRSDELKESIASSLYDATREMCMTREADGHLPSDTQDAIAGAELWAKVAREELNSRVPPPNFVYDEESACFMAIEKRSIKELDKELVSYFIAGACLQLEGEMIY